MVKVDVVDAGSPSPAPIARPQLPSLPPTAASTPAVEVPAGPWSLGTGIELAANQDQGNDLYTTLILASLGGYGMFLTSLLPDRPARVNFFLEYQLLEQLALMVQARGGFSYLQNSNLSSNSIIMPGNRYDWSAGVAIGCRFIVNPKGPVEFSVLGVPYLDYEGNHITSRSNPTDPNSEGTVVLVHYLRGGVELGLAVEKQLLPNLDLRLQTSLVDINGRWGIMGQRSTTDAAPINFFDTASPTQVRVGADLKIAPTLELRLHF